MATVPKWPPQKVLSELHEEGQAASNFLSNPAIRRPEISPFPSLLYTYMYSLNKYLSSFYFMPSPVLDTRNTEGNKSSEGPFS